MNAVALEMEYEPSPAPTLLKQQVGEKLAAHRSRRAKTLVAGQAETASPLEAPASSRSQRIASAVAERYAHSPSYHAFLAAEAEEATRRARATAEIAARTADAVAAAQQELMAELAATRGSGAAMLDGVDAAPLESVWTSEARIAETADERATVVQVSRAGLSVRLFEDAGRLAQRGGSEAKRTSGRTEPMLDDPEEARALDEEISFRQSPTFELERPSVAIPGNLLEFPRQLVAARKARPRYAEGPLLEEGGHDGAQLRIFEVEAEQMAATPPVESAAAEWSSIWLDALAVSVQEEPTAGAAARVIALLEPVSMERRVMAAMVDGCLILAGYVGFATVFAYRAVVLPSLGVTTVASAVAIVGLFVMYEALFFTFSEATPGMRYARIGLCTFDDENPTRAAMRKRIAAVLLAGCPLGLGFLWAWVDDDRLGWHDRISGMYQRGY